MRDDIDFDPRDCIWEEDRPTYRVYFWHQLPAPPGFPQDRVGYQCDEHRLVGATDVNEVLAWAEGKRQGDDTYTLYVEVDVSQPAAGEVGLVRLAGVDPTVRTGPPNESAIATVWISDAQ